MRTDGRQRVLIEKVEPELDDGRYAIKRIVGDELVVTATAFADGHDVIAAVLLVRLPGADEWLQVPMVGRGQDSFEARFRVTHLGEWQYTVEAWIDEYRTWQRGFEKKIAAGQNVDVEGKVGVALLEEVRKHAPVGVGAGFVAAIDALSRNPSYAAEALQPHVAELVDRHGPRHNATRYRHELRVIVDRERARFSAWYEFFPRSMGPSPEQHGTFNDCIARLPYVAGMGFNILYLPPIHPIGHAFRKGRNNAVSAVEGDVGSPWAIGAAEGGHTAIHPQLGTIKDFRRLVAAARERNIDIALDIALQCSPEHPWVREHPQWFKNRPDGTIQYAENPPKKYQDIYPLNFESDDWQSLWTALKEVFEYWIAEGVRIFRVDNPHTKAFAFWHWVIAELKRETPDLIFLAEAFARPIVMETLAKVGFTQSYTYFTWRNTKWELTEYFEYLNRPKVREFMHPNVWPNTPDILPEFLQAGGRPAFESRIVLAATLASSYGVYGPAFELADNRPREPGSEEYLDSEKYQLRHWDLRRSDSLVPLITRLNQIRHENAVLQVDGNLQFHTIENDQMLAYSRTSDDGSIGLLIVVNLDPHHKHAGWLHFASEEAGITGPRPFQVHDLLSDSRYLWHGGRHYVELDPQVMPAHVFRVRRWVRSEQQFEYFL
jgi:starch synthase (maltosyl-transferring)